MLTNQLHALLLLIILVTRDVTHSIRLEDCTEKGENFSIVEVSNLTCYRDQRYQAERRHNFHIRNLGRDKKNTYLRCPICPGEDREQFIWKYIPHRGGVNLFTNDSQFPYGSSQILDEKHLREVSVGCLIPNSSDLYLNHSKPESLLGTYVCQKKGSTKHAANFIWYHLDKVDFERSDPMNIVKSEKVLIKNEAQFDMIYKNDLIKASNFPTLHQKKFGPFLMTFELYKAPILLEKCGLVKVDLSKVCYIAIPKEEPENINRTSYRVAYRLLRESFSFLVRATGLGGADGRWIYTQLEEDMHQLNFGFHGNGSHLYIPCAYTFLRHLEVFRTQMGSHIPHRYYTSVEYEIACPDVTFENLMKLAHMSDLDGIKLEIPTLRDHRYMKVIHHVFESQKNLRLRCATHKLIRCNQSLPDALWKSGNDLTFAHPKENKSKSDNIYTTDECELHFVEVHRYDVDVYYCYLRDPQAMTAVWSRRPRIAYRLSLEQATFSWPRKQDLMVGLVVLTAWSILLIGLWILLSLYDTVTQERAIFEATVKQAGGRMARVKTVYSPFSDDDRALFMRLLHN